MKFRLGSVYLCFVLVFLSLLSPAQATPKNTILGTVVIGSDANGMAVSPDSRYVYVADLSDNTVTVIDSTINQITATIPQVTGAQFLALSANAETLFAAGFDSNADQTDLTVIATSTNTVTKTIRLGPNANGILATRPAGAEVYFGNPNGITIIDTVHSRISGSINLGGRPTAVSFTPDGKRAYVAYSRLARKPKPTAFIDLIDCSTRSIAITKMAENNVPQPRQTNFFLDLSLNPNHSALYVQDNQSNQLNTIEAINLHDKTTVSTLYTAPSTAFLTSERVTPDGQYLYVAMETPDSMVTVALPSGSVVGQPLSVGYGDEIAISPDGQRAYVSALTSDSGGNGIVTIVDITPQ